MSAPKPAKAPRAGRPPAPGGLVSPRGEVLAVEVDIALPPSGESALAAIHIPELRVGESVFVLGAARGDRLKSSLNQIRHGQFFVGRECVHLGQIGVRIWRKA